MSKKIAVVSLGCDKNRVDTENMLWYLSSGDCTITDDYADADFIIINTCAFIESARVEAIDTILQLSEYKTIGKCKKLIVTGCLPQKYREELFKQMPEIDAMLGIDEYEKITEIVLGQSASQKSYGRVLTTPPHYAFLRISDGCNNYCTFCTIPSIRGKYRSTPMDVLIEQAKDFSTKGVSELILVAQDVTSYGKDLFGKPMLIELLRELVKLDIKWIRLMYCYPELVTDDLIEFIANEPKMAKYIDIPMQHVSNSVLKRMNRRSNYEQLCSICEKLNDKGIELRTTFMVGFPGETEEDLSLLVDFVNKYKPLNAGIFAYSKEDETPSAKLKDQLTKRVKLSRVNKLGKAVASAITEKNKQYIGKTVEIVYEDIDYDRGLFVGRTQYDAPEIDRKVFFKAKYADVGNYYKVKITDFDEYDLIGEIEDEFTD
ncbi:MAG: 30S ribosomal protein S12 methylthiotransferase RimO [Clostridia bacterium]|nr:30S ribosomal protein S12 methylthiotransferase RimO [Clostridia bacterium]